MRRSILDMYVDYLSPEERQELRAELERAERRQKRFFAVVTVLALVAIIVAAIVRLMD